MLTAPAPKAHAVPCSVCGGECRVPDDWEYPNGVPVVVAYRPCGACLRQGWMLSTDERRTVERWEAKGPADID